MSFSRELRNGGLSRIIQAETAEDLVFRPLRQWAIWRGMTQLGWTEEKADRGIGRIRLKDEKDRVKVIVESMNETLSALWEERSTKSEKLFHSAERKRTLEVPVSSFSVPDASGGRQNSTYRTAGFISDAGLATTSPMKAAMKVINSIPCLPVFQKQQGFLSYR